MKKIDIRLLFNMIIFIVALSLAIIFRKIATSPMIYLYALIVAVVFFIINASIFKKEQ